MEAASLWYRARLYFGCVSASLIIGLACCLTQESASAAGYRTQNFLVEASSQQLAQRVGEAAERYRRDLAVHWLGEPLGNWPEPCPIQVIDGPNKAAQGITQYDRSPVRNFVMEVVGTQQRILDSVLPHEVTHTVLATHFGRPLPRWADEGICSTVEHESERAKHEAKLREFLRSRRGIAMNQLFLLTEYPNDVLPMYAQGYSVCQFLIGQRGPRQFIEFLHDYMERSSWTESVRKHYGYESLGELQEYWLAWVSEGSGAVEKFAKLPPPDSEDRGEEDDQLASRSQEGNSQRGPGGSAPKPGPAPAPATSLASLEADSFYARTRDGRETPKSPESDGSDAAEGVAQADATDNPSTERMPVPKSMIPPSIKNSGRYSAAQPQPEQGGATDRPHRDPLGGTGHPTLALDPLGLATQGARNLLVFLLPIADFPHATSRMD